MASVKNTNLKNIVLRERIFRSNNPKFITMVLLAIDKGVNRPTEFSTHIRHMERDSMSEGHYFTKLIDAEKDFLERH